MKLDVARGNLPEPFLSDPGFLHLLSMIDEDRIVDKKALEDELYVVGRGDTTNHFFDAHLEMGHQRDIYSNPDHSHIAYAIHLTAEAPPCEPMLEFDRGRTESADVDIDIEHIRRPEVRDYNKGKFGADHVAHIATYTTFKDKGVIKDAARVFQIPLAEVNKALKKVNVSPATDFFEDFKASTEGKKFNQKYPEVLKLATALRGKIRGRGMHAAALVISKEPLSNYVSIESAKDDLTGERVTLVGLDKDQVEDVGLIKMDFLGLLNLSIIKECLAIIKDNRGITIDINDVKPNDPKVFEMLSAGKTKGVFQCEAGPYTKLIRDMGGVNNFDELVASNALVRPGAMNSIGKEYIACKKGMKKAKPIHEDLAQYTEDTYHQVIYQEQVMQTLVHLAGFSASEADKVRKIIGKKKDVSALDAYEAKFIEGATKKVTVAKANKLWKDFQAHADYSFNKSHAVAYSMISYYTAWLKCYYSQEFIVANLRLQDDPMSKTEFLIEAMRLGLKIEMPHVNKSGVGYTIEGKSIRIGLSDIKYLSETSAQNLINQRPFVSYQHLYDTVMTKGNGLNVRVLNGLNAIGGAPFYDNPSKSETDIKANMYEYLGLPSFDDLDWPDYVNDQITNAEDYEEGDAALIKGMVSEVKVGAGWSRIDFLDPTGKASAFDEQDTELQKGEIYLALLVGNSIAQVMRKSDLEDPSVLKIFLENDDFSELQEGQYFVLANKGRTTKAGKKMSTVALVDRDRNIVSAMVFPQLYAKAAMWLKPGNLAKVQLSETQDGSIFVGDIRV